MPKKSHTGAPDLKGPHMNNISTFCGEIQMMRVKLMMRAVTLTHALMRIISIKVKLSNSSF